MLTRRAFTGVVGCAICGLTDIAGTGAAAQGSPPAPTTGRASATLDPRIRRVLRTRSSKERLDLDIHRGRVVIDSPSPGVAAALATKPVLVELSSDRIPEGFQRHRWSRIANRIYAADLPLDEIERLGRERGVVYIEAGRTLQPMLETSRAEIKADIVQAPPAGTPGLDGTGVIVGIIDDGLDFTLDDFRDASGATRIAFLWDQSLSPRPGEASPAGFGFGVEYDAAAINRALQASNPFAVVRTGLASENGTHGTHVAGIAVGNGRSHDAQFPAGRFVGVAPAATIIFVDTKRGSGNLTDSVNLARAVSYIFKKADELGRPCVINISKGGGGGSHDGESIVERAIDDLLVEQLGRALVKSAGNLHTHRGHASGRLVSGQTRRLTWSVGNDDRTQNEIEIWYSSRDRLRVRLTSPTGRATPWVHAGEPFDQPADPNNPHITIEAERFTALNGDSLTYIEVDPPKGAAVPPGNWIIEIEALEIQDGTFDAWIERDDEHHLGFSGSDFDPVRTLSPPGTGHRTITVANYNHHVAPPAINRSSGRGRTRDGRMKPEVAAPGTDILSSRSLGGRRDGHGGVFPMRVKKSGTSMAAPHVAGAIALVLQRHPCLTAAQIRAALIASAVRESGMSDFRDDFGFGRVDIARCLKLLDEAPIICEDLRRPPR